MSAPLRIGLLGARGRMGTAVTACVEASTDLIIAAAVDSGDDLATLARSQVIVDFSRPQATLAALRLTATAGIPIVLGTTGFSADQEQEISAAAAHRPLLRASNTSVGAALLHLLLKRAAAALPDADIEIVETHHKHKLDAPSGTALALADTAVGERPGARIVRERNGPSPRQPGDIGVVAVRGGQVVGEHRVLLFAEDELIELRHDVSDRRCFAKGALRAARWLVDRGEGPGLYGMHDVLAHLA